MKSLKIFKILIKKKLINIIYLCEVVFGVNVSVVSVSSAGMTNSNSNKVEEEPVPEQTEFDVILEPVPSDKVIAAIKCTRKVTGLGLKESKDVVVAAPVTILQGVSKEKAEEAKQIFEESALNIVIK